MPLLSFALALALSSGLALAEPAWIPTGPERGHVVSAGIGEQGASVVTRVGVMTADPRLEKWARDPRFPPETRRLAYGRDDLIWAAPAGRLWRISTESSTPARPDPARTELVLCLPEGTTIVDMETSGSGSVFMALRGTRPGILRLDKEHLDTPALQAEGELADPRCRAPQPGQPGPDVATWDFSPFEFVMADVDPWRIATHGRDILAGTVDAGLHLSHDDGRHFEQILQEGPIAAVAFRGDEPWAGLADGRLLRGREPKPVSYLALGTIQDIAALGSEVLISNRWGLARWTEAEGLVRLNLNLNEDHPGESVTGIWALPHGGALVGSFRRGPLKWIEGVLSPARSGFQSAVVGGAAADRKGRVLLALMGTGAYLTQDSGLTWKPESGSAAPVTDAVGVIGAGDSFAVVDFEGWTLKEASGEWTRLAGNTATAQDGRRSGIVDVALDAAGRWWGVDGMQSLWSWNGASWDRCVFFGALRLDGSGDALHLISHQGLYRIGSKKRSERDDCSASWQKVELALPAKIEGGRVRADGDWVAIPGELRVAGQKVRDLPVEGASALSVRGMEALIGLGTNEVLHCRREGSSVSCEIQGPKLPAPAQALGWFPDGRIWAAEILGTILVLEQNAETTGALPWSLVSARKVGTKGLPELERAPWSDEGQPGAGRPANASATAGAKAAASFPSPPPPKPAHPSWLLYFGVGLGSMLLVFAGVTFWWVRMMRARRASRPS